MSKFSWIFLIVILFMRNFHFMSFFPNFMPFISFPYHVILQRTYSTMLNKSSDAMVNTFVFPFFKRVLKTSNKSDNKNQDSDCLRVRVGQLI